MGTDAFDQLTIQARDALREIANGSADGYRALYSKRDDITLGNPFGGFARGWDAVFEQIERAATYYRDGELVGFDTVMEWVGDDLAYTVEIERFKTKVGGAAEAQDVALRVTCIYRREDEGWKLWHRHADPRVTRQTAESVLHP